jgi:hypothetical protein
MNAHDAVPVFDREASEVSSTNLSEGGFDGTGSVARRPKAFVHLTAEFELRRIFSVTIRAD